MGVVKHAYESEPLVDWYCHIDPAVMDLMLMDEPQIKVAADIGVACGMCKKLGTGETCVMYMHGCMPPRLIRFILYFNIPGLIISCS